MIVVWGWICDGQVLDILLRLVPHCLQSASIGWLSALRFFEDAAACFTADADVCPRDAESTLHLVLRLRGGMGHKSNPWKKAHSKMRWKWKKKRTRRLQRKRRKMRQRSK